MRFLMMIMVLVVGFTGVLHASEPMAAFSDAGSVEAHDMMVHEDVSDCCTGETDGFVHCQPFAAVSHLPELQEITSGYTRVTQLFDDVLLASAEGDKLLDPPRFV